MCTLRTFSDGSHLPCYDSKEKEISTRTRQKILCLGSWNVSLSQDSVWCRHLFAPRSDSCAQQSEGVSFDQPHRSERRL